MKLSILAGLTTLLLCWQAHAYTVFSLGEINWNRIQDVDVFVVGEGPEMGGLFVYSAITTARYLKEKSPSSRAQVIFWAKEKSKQAHIDDLESRDLRVLLSNDEEFTVEMLEGHLMSLPSVNSLHVYSHSNTSGGLRLQSGRTSLNHTSMNWRRLRSKFTRDSYLVFYGCNNGFNIAPDVSAAIRRPVLGSLTGTDFQEIFEDNKWYHHNVGQFPSDMGKSTWNNLLFNQREACWKGNCTRMKPNNHPYRGRWGRYETGLPYYKSFCNYGRNTRGRVSSDCMAGIAQAVRSWPVERGISNHARVVDFLCPINPGYSTRENCVDYLSGRSDRPIFWGNTLSCDLSGCRYETKRSRNTEGQTVSTFTSSDQGNAPFWSEYNLLMNALERY